MSSDAAIRTATVSRETSETSIKCTLTLDVVPGVHKQEINVSTGIGFLDHVSPTSQSRLGPASLCIPADSYRFLSSRRCRCSPPWPNTDRCPSTCNAKETCTSTTTIPPKTVLWHSGRLSRRLWERGEGSGGTEALMRLWTRYVGPGQM